MGLLDNNNLSLWLTLFGQNIAMGFVAVAAFAAIWAALEGRWRRAEPVIVGLLFGAAGIISMLAPVRIADGIILDMRNVFVVVGGLFAGPLGASVAAALVGLYRLYIGGAGMVSGVGGIVTAGLVGALIARRYGERVKEFGLFQLAVIGLVDAVATIAWTRAIFAIKGLAPLPVVAEVSVLVIYPAATALLGIAMSVIHYRVWRSSHRRLSDILEISSELVWEQDVAGRMVYASERYAELFGMPVAEIVGKTPDELGWTPIDTTTRRAHEAAFFAHLPFRELSFVQPTKSGTPKLISVTGRPILDGRGRYFGYRGTATDITEREKLRTLVATISGQVSNVVGEEFLKTLINSVAEVLDADVVQVGRFDHAAGMVRELYVSAKESFVAGREFAFDGLPAGIVATGKPLIVPSGLFTQFPLLQKIGRFKVEAYAAIPLIGGKGEVLGLLSVLSHHPIEAPEYIETVLNLFAGRAASELERIIREEEAERSRRRMAEVLAALDIERDAIIITDIDGAITYTNRSAVELLGLPPDGAAVGHRLRDLGAERGFAAIADTAVATLSADGEWEGSAPWVRPSDGKKIVFEARARSVPGGGTVTVIADATERLRLEVEERLHQERLERAQRVGQIGSIEADLVAGTSVWSNELYRILGLDPASGVAGFNVFLQFVHPDDRAEFKRLRENSAAGRTNEPTEFRIVRPNGEVRWIFRQGETIFDADGKVRTLVATLLDITERKNLEEELRRSHQGLVHAQRLGKIGSTENDLKTGEVVWSDEQYRLFGLDPMEGGASLSLFMSKVHPDDRERVAALRDQNARGIATEPTEFRIVLPGGKIRWMHREVGMVHDSDGKPIKFLTTQQDITERKHLEETLRKSHNGLVQAQRIGNIGAVEADYLTGEAFWSDELCHIMGIDPADAPRTTAQSRETFNGLIHPDDRQRMSNMVASNRQGQQSAPVDLRIVRPSGEIRWLHREADIFVTPDGKARGGIATYQDITDQRRMEAELRRSHERLERAQNVGKIGSVETNLLTGEEFFSRELFEITGLDPGVSRPLLQSLLALIHPDDRQQVRELIKANRQGIVTTPVDFRIQRPDGEWRWLHREGEPILGAGGTPVATLAVIQDITERKRMEVELAAREESLLRSARHLGSAQRVGRMGSVEIDLATGQTEWSAETFQLFGLDSIDGHPQEKRFMTLVHPDDREKLHHARAKEVEGIETEPMEYRLTRPDGELRWIYRQTDLVRDAENKPTRLIVTHQDLTEREKLRRVLETLSGNVGNLIGEDFLRSLVTSVSQALGAEFVYIGRFDIDEGVVRTEYVIAEGAAADNKVFPFKGAPSEAIAFGQTVVISSNVQERFPTNKGPWGSDIEGYAGTPLYGAKGNLLGLLVAMSNRPWETQDYVQTVITLFARRAAAEIERLAIEQDVERSSDRMAEILAALDIARNPVVLADEEWRIRYFNNVAIDTLGLPNDPDLVLGKPLRDFQFGSDYLDLGMEIRKIIATAGEWQGLVPWVRPSDGRRLVLDCSINRLPQGGYVQVATDATARVKLEEEQRRHLEHQAQAGKLEALGNLAGGIAHDFNNLLGAVLGFGQFLVQDLTPGTDQHKFAERIVGVSQRGRSLVQQILTFSRRSVVEPTRVRVKETVTETYDLLHATLPATTQLTIDDAVPGATILADRGQMLQVLVNLCANASDALEGDPGTVAVSIALLDRKRLDLSRIPTGQGRPSVAAVETWRDEDGTGHIATGAVPRGECISLSVADTGSGIPDAMLTQIFEPFVTTKEKGRGTGLGLAVVHRIVVEHGGAIFVTTRRNRGTSFEVLLPLAQRMNESESEEETGDDQVDRNVDMAADSTATILVVDDDEAYCAMVQTALRRAGYQVQSTNDPRIALGWIRHGQQKWDVLVSDQTMPHMKGVDLVRSFKALSPATRCIICTGFSSGLSEQQALAAGADGFMLKPFNVGELAGLVAQLLARENEIPLSKV